MCVYLLSIYLTLTDVTARDKISQAFTFQNTGGSEGLRRLKRTHHIPSSLREVCNLMKGSGFLLLSVDWALLTLFFAFFAGRPITVTSWPFGRPRLRRIGGMLISEYMCVQYFKKWHYANIYYDSTYLLDKLHQIHFHILAPCCFAHFLMSFVCYHESLTPVWI